MEAKAKLSAVLMAPVLLEWALSVLRMLQAHGMVGTGDVAPGPGDMASTIGIHTLRSMNSCRRLWDACCRLLGA